MKQIRYISLFVGAAVLLASCNKNEPISFDDKNAFAAFDNTTMYVSEGSQDNLLIPVTLASVKGLEETMKFEIIEAPSDDAKGARNGVNYELVTSSGVLTFDSEHRTQYIEIKPLYYPEYTGDLSFSIKLIDSETLATGSENVCKVIVTDIDHPLSFMLGAYTATGVNYWDGPTEWTMTFYKDEKDDSMVWIDNLFDVAGLANEKTRYYGVVNEDKTVLNIPFGQETVYKYSNGNPVTLLGFDGESGYDTGSVDVAIIVNNGKVTLDFGTQWGIWVWIKDAGNLNITNPGIVAVQN